MLQFGCLLFSTFSFKIARRLVHLDLSVSVVNLFSCTQKYFPNLALKPHLNSGMVKNPISTNIKIHLSFAITLQYVQHSVESVTSHFMRMVMQSHCSCFAGEQKKKPLERIEDSVLCERSGQVYILKVSY